MDLSIIITSKDTRELLFLCLNSIYTTLEKAAFTYEIIVIDNASTDGTPEQIRKDFKKVHLIQNKTNLGFGKANNQGIAASKGTYILLLNSDTQVFPGAIGKLLAFSIAHQNAFIGPKLMNPDNTPQTSCGPFFDLKTVFAILFLKGDTLGITRWSPKTTKKVDWVSGACLIAPKRIFTDGLLFDEDIFMYMDEIDLLYRGKSKGYEVYFYPESVVKHVGSGSSKDKRKGPILNIYRGFQMFYKKHYPGWQLPVLRGMLQSKAILGIVYGWATGKKDVRTTYEEAFRLA